MATDTTRGGPSPPSAGALPVLRIGTWNMSHWTAPKVSLVASDIAMDILALQETHLAPIPLEVAHTTARNAGLHLHHGGPVTPMAHSEHGRSCGVGFLTRNHLPLLPAIPNCPAWRRLAAMRRLHGVRLAPRAGLPLGLLLLSIYAPLQTQSAERSIFTNAFLDLVHSLDMQQPTLLLGDFNGSACPARDYGGHRSQQLPVCTLLAQLLGPASPWTDVHDALLQPPLPMTFRITHRSGAALVSRIDLVLANAPALLLVRAASVREDINDGGHCPVMVELQLASGILDWRPPPGLAFLRCCISLRWSCAPRRSGSPCCNAGWPTPPSSSLSTSRSRTHSTRCPAIYASPSSSSSPWQAAGLHALHHDAWPTTPTPSVTPVNSSAACSTSYTSALRRRRRGRVPGRPHGCASSTSWPTAGSPSRAPPSRSYGRRSPRRRFTGDRSSTPWCGTCGGRGLNAGGRCCRRCGRSGRRSSIGGWRRRASRGVRGRS